MQCALLCVAAALPCRRPPCRRVGHGPHPPRSPPLSPPSACGRWRAAARARPARTQATRRITNQTMSVWRKTGAMHVAMRVQAACRYGMHAADAAAQKDPLELCCFSAAPLRGVARNCTALSGKLHQGRNLGSGCVTHACQCVGTNCCGQAVQVRRTLWQGVGCMAQHRWCQELRRIHWNFAASARALAGQARNCTALSGKLHQSPEPSGYACVCVRGDKSMHGVTQLIQVGKYELRRIHWILLLQRAPLRDVLATVLPFRVSFISAH